MARKSRETERPTRRRKRNADTPATRTPPKKKSSPAITIAAVFVVMGIAWATLVKDDGKIPSGKIAPSIIGALDQVYLGCTVYWFNKGGHLPCGQDIADRIHDSKTGDIKVTVTNNLRKDFSATGRHIADPMVFRVDSNGEIFIKVKECEINVNSLVISKIDLAELEAQCKPK
jgi:hypothetical protein